MNIRGEVAKFLLRGACALSETAANLVELGLQRMHELEAEQADDRPLWLRDQTPDIVKRLGWEPIMYNHQSDVRITIDRNPKIPDRPVFCYVDFRNGPGAHVQFKTLAEAASKSLELVDLIEERMAAIKKEGATEEE